MKWAEFILLRAAGDAGRSAYRTMEHIAASLKEPGLIDVAVYHHAAISGDFAVALLWDTEKPCPWGSGAGLELVGELKRLGLVDYSVWMRMGQEQGD